MYICVNGHRSASCIHAEGGHRMCSQPGCQAEAEKDDDAGLSAVLERARMEGYRSGVIDMRDVMRAELVARTSCLLEGRTP